MKFLQWLIGIAITSLILHIFGMQIEKGRWSITEAIIDRTEIVETNHPNYRNRTIFILMAHYSFEVNGVTFDAEKPAYFSSTRELAEHESGKFPDGRTIKIRYNTERPTNSEIEDPKVPKGI